MTETDMIRPLWVMIAATMMIDALTTGIAFTVLSDGAPVEGNPLFVWLFAEVGVVPAMIGKGVIGVVTAWLLARRAANVSGADDGRGMLWLRRLPREKIQRDAVWTMAVMLLVMGVVCGNNIRAVVIQATSS